LCVREVSWFYCGWRLERLILGVCWGGLLGDGGRTIRDVEGFVLGTIRDVEGFVLGTIRVYGYPYLYMKGMVPARGPYISVGV